MKTRTVVAAVIYSIIAWLALEFNLFASGVWREPVSPWIIVISAVLLTGWAGLLLRRSSVLWWAIVGTYSLALVLIAVRLRLSCSDAEAIEALSFIILPLGLCLLALICLPLLILATDRPRRWNNFEQRAASTRRMLLTKAGISIIVISTVVIVSFSFYKNPPARRVQEDNIRETVLRYQFQHNGSGIQQNAGAYYISLYDEGVEPASPVKEFALIVHALVFDRPGVPSDGFIRRFRGHSPPVKKVSQCILEINGIRDRKTGQRGLMLSVGRIKWINDQTVEVNGGYYEGGMSASGNTYRVVRREKTWVVVSDKLEWVS